MPRIAELREIDGQIWVRVDIDLKSEDQPVYLWTESEQSENRNRLLEDACAAILGLKV